MYGLLGVKPALSSIHSTRLRSDAMEGTNRCDGDTARP